jgi:hypothetical protein
MLTYWYIESSFTTYLGTCGADNSPRHFCYSPTCRWGASWRLTSDSAPASALRVCYNQITISVGTTCQNAALFSAHEFLLLGFVFNKEGSQRSGREQMSSGINLPLVASAAVLSVFRPAHHGVGFGPPFVRCGNCCTIRFPTGERVGIRFRRTAAHCKQDTSYRSSCGYILASSVLLRDRTVSCTTIIPNSLIY